MDISVAFLALAFCFVVAGVSLVSVPAGVITAGILLGAAGLSLVTVDKTKVAK